MSTESSQNFLDAYGFEPEQVAYGIKDPTVLATILENSFCTPETLKPENLSRLAQPVQDQVAQVLTQTLQDRKTLSPREKEQKLYQGSLDFLAAFGSYAFRASPEEIRAYVHYRQKTKDTSSKGRTAWYKKNTDALICPLDAKTLKVWIDAGKIMYKNLPPGMDDGMTKDHGQLLLQDDTAVTIDIQVFKGHPIVRIVSWTDEPITEEYTTTLF